MNPDTAPGDHARPEPDPRPPSRPQPPAPALVPPSAPAPKRSRLPLIVGVIVAVLVAAGLGIGLGTGFGLRGGTARPAKPAPAAAPFNLHGTVLIVALTGVQDMDSTACTGTGEYHDIGTGTQVVITDQSGAKLATSQLGVGMLISSGQCYFSFTVPSVPRGKSSYGVTVSNRETARFNQTEMISGPQVVLGG